MTVKNHEDEDWFKPSLITKEVADAIAKEAIAKIDDKTKKQKHEKIEQKAWELYVHDTTGVCIEACWDAAEDFCTFAKMKEKENGDD